MPKPKVEKIEVGYIGGDYQEVFINGNPHTFNIYWTASTVLEELEPQDYPIAWQPLPKSYKVLQGNCEVQDETN